MLFASSTNVKSGPRFAKVWSAFNKKTFHKRRKNYLQKVVGVRLNDDKLCGEKGIFIVFPHMYVTELGMNRTSSLFSVFLMFKCLLGLFNFTIVNIKRRPGL